MYLFNSRNRRAPRPLYHQLKLAPYSGVCSDWCCEGLLLITCANCGFVKRPSKKVTRAELEKFSEGCPNGSKRRKRPDKSALPKDYPYLRSR